MKEILIPVEFANVVDFYGVNDANLDIIRKKFPALKIVARGNEIKIIGDELQVATLMEKLNRLVSYFQDKGTLSITDVEHLLNGGAEGGSISPEISIINPPGKYGPIIINALINWLLVSPFIEILPPCSFDE